MSDNNSPRGLRKELKLSNMITMAAGGMIAAWMVEIKLWYELSGPGSVFAFGNFDFTTLLYIFRNVKYDALCWRTEYMGIECAR